MRIGLAVFLLAIFSLPVLGQDPQHANTVVRGVVVDRESGTPLAGAFVEISELKRRAYTNAAGSFAIRGVAEGSHVIRVRQLGYLEAEAISAAGEQPLTIALIPQPHLLEAVQVIVNRLDRRLKSVPYATRVSRREDLLRSTAPSLAEHLTSRWALHTGPCAPTASATGCIQDRGRTVPLRVYLDDSLIPAGWIMLEHFQPSDLYRVEVIETQVRLYTEWYIERVMKNGTLPPICVVCG